MVRLKTELEEANLDQALLTMYYVGLQFKEQCIVQEGVLGAMRAKHNNTMAELGTQIDELNKSKCKTERDKVLLQFPIMFCIELHRGALRQTWLRSGRGWKKDFASGPTLRSRASSALPALRRRTTGSMKSQGIVSEVAFKYIYFFVN